MWIKLVTDHFIDHYIPLIWYSKVCNGLNLCLVLQTFDTCMHNRKSQLGSYKMK
jgi:hypothetical protein